MAKNVEIKIEGKTLEQIMADLKTTVEAYNASKDIAERARLEIEASKLKSDYNKCSKETAYATCLEADNPMLAFIQMYTYPVIGLNIKKDTKELALKTESKNGKKMVDVFNLWDFVAYCEERNKQVTVGLDWKSKAVAAQKALIAVLKTDNETGVYNIGEFKNALQAAFDSIVFVAGKNGNNAVIAKSKQCRIIKNAAGELNKKDREVQFVSEKSWQAKVFAYLNLAVDGKEFVCTYGDAEEKTDEAATEEKTDETK